MPERTDGLCAGEEKAYHDFAVSNGRSLLYSYSISSASSYASISPIQSDTYKRIEVGFNSDISSWFTTLGGTASNIRVIDERVAKVTGTTLTALSWGKTQIICDNSSFRVITLEVRPKGAFAMPMVSAGGNFTLALKADGTVWSWGENGFGQLGQNNTYDYRYPKQVLPGASGSGYYMENMIQVSAAQRHALVLRYDGAVFAWGRNNGRLGNNTTKDGKVLLPIQTSISSVVQIRADLYSSSFITTGGSLYVCGGNNDGVNLGIGGAEVIGSPTYVSIGYRVVDAQVAFRGGLAVDYRGQVWHWGNQLGSAEMAPGCSGDGKGHKASKKPVQVPTSQLSRVVEVTTIGGGPARFALTADGNVYLWGRGETIQGSTYVNEAYLMISGVIHISGAGGGGETDDPNGNKAMAAQKKDGTIYTWGSNYYGQHGDGSWSSSTSPGASKVSNQTLQFEGARSGQSNYESVRADGSVWGWGRNNYGQLGNYSTSDAATPVRAGGDYDISSVIHVTAAEINNSTTGKPVTSYTEANPMPTTITLGEDETLIIDTNKITQTVSGGFLLIEGTSYVVFICPAV